MKEQHAPTSRSGGESLPVVLIVGATGQTGRRIVDEFGPDPQGVRLRLAARKQADVETLRAEGREAVLLDLDDPRTFGLALAGVDRLYLLTGYTVAMCHQSKTLVDGAVKAGVSHIVHHGIFGNWDCTDPHFAWHTLVEKYVEASGVSWTHLHPNVFMENLTGVTPLKGGKFSMFCGDRRVGWVALNDLAAVAAAVLRQGPGRHGGKDYWLSTEVMSGPEVAALLTEVLGREIRCELKTPEDMRSHLATVETKVEPNYAESNVKSQGQIVDGRKGYVGTVRDDVPFVTGRASTTFRRWATDNRDVLLEAAEK